jgi:hypothetical protein
MQISCTRMGFSKVMLQWQLLSTSSNTWNTQIPTCQSFFQTFMVAQGLCSPWLLPIVSYASLQGNYLLTFPSLHLIITYFGQGFCVCSSLTWTRADHSSTHFFTHKVLNISFVSFRLKMSLILPLGHSYHNLHTLLIHDYNRLNLYSRICT